MADTDFDLPLEEQELTPAPLATIGEQLSPSPFHFLFTGEDRLQIESWNSVSGVRVSVQGRVWDRKTGIRTFAHEHVPNTDRSLATELLTFGTGYLLNCVVFAGDGSPRVGQTFISLHVVRGATGGLTRLATLVQGYVTRSQELAFPGSPILTSEEGSGTIRSILSTDPAANTGIHETVPTGARWQLLAVHATLTASALAGDRLAYVYAYDGTQVYGYFPSPVRTAASATRIYQWHAGLGNGIDYSVGSQSFPLPAELVLLAGFAFGISWTGALFGDDITAARYVVREWLEAQ